MNSYIYINQESHSLSIVTVTPARPGCGALVHKVDEDRCFHLMHCLELSLAIRVHSAHAFSAARCFSFHLFWQERLRNTTLMPLLNRSQM